MRIWCALLALGLVGLLACSSSERSRGDDDDAGAAGQGGASAGRAGAGSGGLGGTVQAGAGAAGLAGGLGGAAAGSAGNGGGAGSSGSGVAGGGSGGNATAGTGGSGDWDWPTYEEAAAGPKSTRVLIVLLDFSDSDMSTFLDDPEEGWSNMMFGTNAGQGNHYWYQTSGGQFQILKAAESSGSPDNGVISVKISSPRPNSGTYVVQDQTWIPEALDLAAADVDFDAFDTNGDGTLQNTELSVLFILNLDYAELSGAGAEANIEILHPIAGTNVVLEKFARSLYYYTSIGTPMHELGHHVLDLDHGPAPTDHDLMGVGAYAEDPLIGELHDPDNHYATRPAGLHGLNKIAAGFVEPTRITETTRGVKLYAPETGKAYNVLELAVQDGFLYLENRTAWGYDQSIPFCEGHTGGVLAIDASQYLSPLDIPGITRYPPLDSFDVPDWIFCDYYALAGHNAPYSFGGWTLENVSAPGPVMTFDLVKNEVVPSIEHYKYRYWADNPDKDGYRMWHFVEAEPDGNVTIDFATFPSGDDPDGYFTISLEAFYATGEVRSLNAKATWTSDTPYLTPLPLGNFTNPGAYLEDTIIQLALFPGQAASDTVTVNVSAGTFHNTITFVNVPVPP